MLFLLHMLHVNCVFIFLYFILNWCYSLCHVTCFAMKKSTFRSLLPNTSLQKGCHETSVPLILDSEQLVSTVHALFLVVLIKIAIVWQQLHFRCNFSKCMTAFKKEKRRLDFVTRKFVIHSLRDIARCYCSRQVLLFINDKRKKDIQFRGVSLSSQSAKLVSVVVSTPQLSSSKSLAKHLLHSLTKTKGTKRKEKKKDKWSMRSCLQWLKKKKSRKLRSFT